MLWRPLEEVRGQFETGRTGADGRWLVELATPVRFLSVYTDPTAEQPSAYHREDRRLESGDSQEVRLELPAAGILSGVVLDAAGAPVPGAEVLGWHTRGEDVWPQVEPHLRVLTDEHGRFRVEDLAGWILLVAQKGQQMATHGLRGALASGATVRDIMLRIDERHELTGTVLTETGEAVAGARVRLESHLPRGNLPPLERASGLGYQGPSAQVTADDGGRFSWSVPVGQAGGVWASAAGFAPAGVPLRPGQERVEVRLGSLSRFTVRVVDHRGEPVAGALVLACRENVFASDPTDVDGWIELRFPKPGPAALLARADGHALTAAGPFDLQPGMAPIELRLGISHNLEGVVVDASGAPIRGAKVRIAGDRLLEGSGRLLDARPTWEALHGLHETVTDAAGGFRFPDLYAGEFRIEVTPEGAALDPAVAYAVAGDDPLRIVLGQGREHMAVLRGRVYDLETGDGVGPCAIQLRHRFERIRSHDRRAVDRPDGRFSFAVLDPSTLAEIMVDAEGYVPAFLHLEGTGTGETDLEIGLRPAATVEIEILDEDGAVLPNAGVWVKDERGESIPLDLIGNTDLICHSLDRSGVIRLPRLPRGTVVIHVGSGQLEGSAKVDTAHLPPGPVRIVLRPRKR